MTTDIMWGPANSPDSPRRGVCARRGPYQEFARRVRGRHHGDLSSALCSCGQLAFLCPDLTDAHELFGDHVPWTPAETLPLRPPDPPEPRPKPAPHPVPYRSTGGGRQ